MQEAKEREEREEKGSKYNKAYTEKSQRRSHTPSQRQGSADEIKADSKEKPDQTTNDKEVQFS